jgi:hypothetical protein
MIWIQPAPPQELTPHTWCFMKPAQCRLRRTDGTEVLVTYGVGDKVRVMDPSTVYSIPPIRMKEEVLLEDGTVITAWPDDLCVTNEAGWARWATKPESGR